MLNIGEFARLGQVSPRMLRHYDDLGLLQPSRVDPATGYRFYAVAQLSRLHRILALRDLGFSLDQISGLLDEDLHRINFGGCCVCAKPKSSRPSLTSRADCAAPKHISEHSKGAPSWPVPTSSSRPPSRCG